MTDSLAPVSDAIRESLSAHFKSLIDERDDWKAAHVSDCYGCLYAVHARRSADAKPVEEREPEACLKMHLGTVIEEIVADGLGDGSVIKRGERIAWNPKTLACKRNVDEDYTPEADEIIGHMDLTIDVPGVGEVLGEIKSTAFFNGRVPKEPSPHYVDQASTYATAINADAAFILIVDRASGRWVIFWLDLPALRDETIVRAIEVLEQTGPDAFPPPPVPRYDWQKKYCSLGSNCACRAKEIEA
jgi:hypothetical protein